MDEGTSQLLSGQDGMVMSLVVWIRSLVLPDGLFLFPLLGAGVVLAAIVIASRRRRLAAPPGRAGSEVQIQALLASGESERAAELYLQSGQARKALPLFDASGNLTKVALCHIALKQPSEAARAYREMGRLAEAAHYFQSSDEWQEAAGCLEKLGSHREAAELYERAGEYGKAAAHLRDLGDVENAARLFEMAGQSTDAAAALLSARGHEPRVMLRAAELFENGGELCRAAECYAGAKEWFRAAELFEEAQEFALAAQAYEHTEAWAQAGSAYERAGAYREARTNFERAGDTLRAAELARQLGDQLGAGQGFYELGAYERAIETLQSVSDDSPQSRAASTLLGRIFLEKGLHERAKDKLRLIAPDKPARKDDVEILMLLADVHEATAEYPQALEILERILEFTPESTEVAERFAQLQERAWGPSTSSAEGYYADRYELRDELGRGGMGVVYLAHDGELERTVAVKFLPQDLADNPNAVKMFRQEARAAAAMNHPNIVHLYDVAVIRGRPCIVMEYVRGKTARDLMKVGDGPKRKALPPAQVARIARDVCYALEYAHYQGVIHRDIKPGNVLISEKGQTKLMDFGISKVLESGTGTESDTQAKGTPQYMPPEQILGSKVDARTDLYALGISVFEMLTTVRPFRGDNVVEQQLNAPLPDPRELGAEIPAALVQIIQKACQKKPDARYASASEMAEAFNTFLIETPSIRNDA